MSVRTNWTDIDPTWDHYILLEQCDFSAYIGRIQPDPSVSPSKSLFGRSKRKCRQPKLAFKTPKSEPTTVRSKVGKLKRATKTTTKVLRKAAVRTTKKQTKTGVEQKPELTQLKEEPMQLEASDLNLSEQSDNEIVNSDSTFAASARNTQRRKPTSRAIRPFAQSDNSVHDRSSVAAASRNPISGSRLSVRKNPTDVLRLPIRSYRAFQPSLTSDLSSHSFLTNDESTVDENIECASCRARDDALGLYDQFCDCSCNPF